MMRVLVNGRTDCRVDPLDRGLQYGDGLFETIAVVDGRPRFLHWHLERLAGGAERLGIAAPDPGCLRAEIAESCTASRAVVKLILTRGVGARGYRPTRDATPTRIVAAFAWPIAPDATALRTGARVGWCRMRLGRNPALAGLKHLNRLEQVLARAEWDDAYMDEGLMLDDEGHVIGATQANLFARVEGRWVTPAIEACGVAGVMRRAFRHWSESRGEPVPERVLSMREIGGATALLLTSSLLGAWPVRELAGRSLDIDPVAAEFNGWLARQ